jgi:hypothetical protein
VNELIAQWDDREKILLGNEIEKLFVLQDRPISKEKKAILVGEISNSGIPIGPLLSGLRKLMGEDLKTIKKATILEAARDFIVDTYDQVQCDYCSEGMVVTKDPEGRYFSLACTCPKGNGKRLVRWNGQASQQINDRLLVVQEL